MSDLTQICVLRLSRPVVSSHLRLEVKQGQRKETLLITSISNYCTKLSFCALTCFGHVLSLSESQAAYHMSVNGKRMYISVMQHSVDVRYKKLLRLQYK